MPIESFKVHEAVRLTGEIRGGHRPAIEKRAKELIEALQISEWNDTLGAKLSGGVRRLVGFIMVTVVPGQVVILDEPTNDVDPLRRRLLWKEIRRIGESGAAVLLVTHNVTEAERAVDRLAVLDRGRVLAQGTPSKLKAEDRGQLRLELHLPPDAPDPELPPFLVHHTRIGRRLLLGVAEEDAARALDWSQSRLASGIAEEYALAATSLEDVYLRLIGRDDAIAEETR